MILGVGCVALAVSLLVSNQNHNALHELDAASIAGGSNQLFSAQSEIVACKKTIGVFSNQIETCQSAVLHTSNQLVEAKAAQATATEQINVLNQQATQQTAQFEAEKQTLVGNLVTLTNHMATLTNQIAASRANLEQANKDYALLENRFRRDVAARLLVERKFNNDAELKNQLEFLKYNPNVKISEDRIREGLNVVVKSNMCYVIAPE